MNPRTIELEVLVFEGCPHAEPAIELARAVSGRFGETVVVRRIEVDSSDKALALGFLGSPSFRVDGEDIERRSTSQGALSCRTYEGGAGLPPTWLVEAALLRARKPRGLLFLCVANSARSQLAEGIARALAPAGIKVWSAGSQPSAVRPEAVAVLAEEGLDISAHRAKGVAELATSEVDTVITLCAEEECPLFLGTATRLHWGLADPASTAGDSTARLAAFRRTRDELRRRMAMIWSR